MICVLYWKPGRGCSAYLEERVRGTGYLYCIGNLAGAVQLSWRRGRGGLDVCCDGNLAGAAQLRWRRGREVT
jgi:hypothetical protein